MKVFASARNVLSVALLVAVCGFPAAAQNTLPQTPPPGPPALSNSLVTANSTNVTILARRAYAASARHVMLNRHNASSCAFMASGPDIGSPTEYGDSVVDGYLQDFYGTDIDAGQPVVVSPADQRATQPGQRTFQSNAPFGDASRDSPRTGILPGTGNAADRPWSDNSGICSPSDRGFAAGRAYIAAHDTSLRDAFAAFDAKDDAKALGLFKASWTKMGYPQAALMVGEMELYGLGAPADTRDSIVWLKRTADFWRGGDDPAPFNPRDPNAMTAGEEAAALLAKIYLVGWQVPRDANEARHWYAKADAFGFIPATHIMGLVYERGYGVKPDLAHAMTYLMRAGKAGYAPSQYELGAIYYTGGDGVAQDKARAGTWLTLAAKQDYPDALYAVGRMYDLGEGGASVDPQRALVYYKEAAVRGQVDAENAIGLSFYQGQGLPKDDIFARMWFERAAEGGSPDAMFNLAVMEVNGEGGKTDLPAAYAWMRLAQKGGLDRAGRAADELAGKLTPEDRAKADAALNGN
jgi:TPR repeat protein